MSHSKEIWKATWRQCRLVGWLVVGGPLRVSLSPKLATWIISSSSSFFFFFRRRRRTNAGAKAPIKATWLETKKVRGDPFRPTKQPTNKHCKALRLKELRYALLELLGEREILTLFAWDSRVNDKEARAVPSRKALQLKDLCKPTPWHQSCSLGSAMSRPTKIKSTRT